MPENYLFLPSTPDAAPAWMPGPQYRSTMDLITTCVLTLFLCVWTAVHLNIPGAEMRGKTWCRIIRPEDFQARLFWILLGLLAPEIVLFVAWKEYIQACIIGRKFNKIWNTNHNQKPKRTGAVKEPGVFMGNVRKCLRTVADAINRWTPNIFRRTSKNPQTSNIKDPERNEDLEKSGKPVQISRPITVQPKSTRKPQNFLVQKAQMLVGLENAIALENAQKAFKRVGTLHVDHHHEADEDSDFSDDEIDWKLRSLRTKGLETAFYTLMGGFEIKFSRDAKNPCKPTCSGPPPCIKRGKGACTGKCPQIRTLTPAGAIKVAKWKLLGPDTMSIADINDKSKADMLGKAIVCIQGLWMAIQIIARWMTDLPVTLVELNTFVHVICALCMYILWMRKPHGVRQPTSIDGDSLTKHQRILLHVRKLKYIEGSELEKIPRGVEEKNIYYWDHELSRFQTRIPAEELDKAGQDNASTDNMEVSILIVPSKTQVPSKIQPQNTNQITSIDEVNQTLQKSSSVMDDRIQFMEKGTPNQSEETINEADLDGISTCIFFDREMLISQADAKLLGTKLGLFKSHPSPESRDSGEGDVCCLSYSPGEEGVCCDPEHTYFYSLNVSGSLLKILSTKGWLKEESVARRRIVQLLGHMYAYIIPSLYGGIHLIVWNGHFPTKLEQYCWRFSGVSVVCGYPALNILLWFRERIRERFLKMMMRNQNEKKRRWSPKKIGYTIIRWFVYTITLPFLILICVLYPLSRLYILVESFISLRSLPAHAYDSVPWTDLWPHL